MSTPIEISVADVDRLLRGQSPPMLLDCRQPEEHEFARFEGGILIPMEEIPTRVGELSASQPIVVYCHLGGRSLMVTQWLRENGFPDAKSMRGGIDAWSQQIDPSIPRYQ